MIPSPSSLSASRSSLSFPASLPSSSSSSFPPPSPPLPTFLGEIQAKRHRSSLSSSTPDSSNIPPSSDHVDDKNMPANGGEAEGKEGMQVDDPTPAPPSTIPSFVARPSVPPKLPLALPSSLLPPASPVPSIDYSQPTVVIMRAFPGFGKSYLTKQLVADFNQRYGPPPPSSSSSAAAAAPSPSSLPISSPSYEIVSADQFFVNSSGTYIYEARYIGLAHATCLHNYLSAIEGKKRLIIVDNTHTQKWEYMNVEKIADMHGYRCVLIEIACINREVLDVLSARNAHGVPHSSSMAMHQRWEKDERAIVVYPFMGKEDMAEYDRIVERKRAAIAAQQERLKQRRPSPQPKSTADAMKMKDKGPRKAPPAHLTNQWNNASIVARLTPGLHPSPSAVPVPSVLPSSSAYSFISASSTVVHTSQTRVLHPSSSAASVSSPPFTIRPVAGVSPLVSTARVSSHPIHLNPQPPVPCPPLSLVPSSSLSSSSSSTSRSSSSAHQWNLQTRGGRSK